MFSQAITLVQESVSIDNDVDISIRENPPQILNNSFQNLSYKVKLGSNNSKSSSICKRTLSHREVNDIPKFDEKEILHNINGIASPGQMLAVMGPSGSGKTTLLNILSGRIQDGWTGKILYGGLEYNNQVKKRIGFVAQHDVAHPHLTVRETLVYAALLRLPRYLSKEEKISKADQVISELSLDRCQNTRVGGIFVRGVSVGEGKRLCIGIEMLNEPSIMFFDEPTSGLDSTIALKTVEIAKNLSDNGLTVVMAIHQPSTRMFKMFDKLLLLSEGHCAYMGKAREALKHFHNLGFKPCLEMNPSEFFLDLCSGNMAEISIPEALSQRINHPIDKSNTKDKASHIIGLETRKTCEQEARRFIREAYIHNDKDQENDQCQGPTTLKAMKPKPTWLTQVQVLFMRGLKERSSDYLNVRKVVEIISLAIISGLLWFNAKHSNDTELSDELGLIFFISMIWGIFPMFQALFVFPQDRVMLAKERASDMYSLSAYFMARVLADVPLDLILPTIFIGVLAPLAHMAGGVSFLLRLVALYLIVLSSQGMGVLVGAAIMDEKKASSFGIVVITTMIMSGGSFIKTIPGFISWLKYLSYQHYGYVLLLKIEYNPNTAFDCGPHGCSTLGKSAELSGYDLNGGGKEILCLLAIIFICRILAYVFLRFNKQTLH